MNGVQGQGFNVRGYMFLTSVGYLQQTLGDEESKRVIGAFSPQARSLMGSLKAADWCPVSVFSEVTEALAVSGGGGDRSKDVLVRCGTHMAQEAANTFFKLVMKMISVEMFCKKLPDFWKRDCSGGKLVLENLSDQSLKFATFDMTGFRHAVCTAAGFTSFAVQTMGKKVNKVTIAGWSADNPSADGATYELSWGD